MWAVVTGSPLKYPHNDDQSINARLNVVNVGTGQSVAIVEVARALARGLGKTIEPHVTGEYRDGDIRHCFADVSLARELLRYEPRVELAEGMSELAEWLAGQTADESVETAHAELRRRGLTI